MLLKLADTVLILINASPSNVNTSWSPAPILLSQKKYLIFDIEN
jgi:hypothetical protein